MLNFWRFSSQGHPCSTQQVQDATLIVIAKQVAVQTLEHVDRA